MKSFLSKTLLTQILLLLPLLHSHTLGDKVTISSASELIKFAIDVNRGIDYKGTTVFLDADIDFAEHSTEFTIIGHDDTLFHGVFDGQGHVIKNLIISSSNSSVGLFGKTEDASIKNIVMDASCTVTCAVTNAQETFVGGIIGAFLQADSIATVENVVNMATVTFAGYSNDNPMYIGGILGYVQFYNPQTVLKNCVNYGTVSHTGLCDTVAAGGIVGVWIAPDIIIGAIQNVVNYGSVVISGNVQTEIGAGGIVGGLMGYVDNAVNLGVVVINGTDSSSSRDLLTINIGGIAGSPQTAVLTNCYWDASTELGPLGLLFLSDIYESSSFNKHTFELTKEVKVGSYTGTSLLGALNAGADLYAHRGYSHWILNRDSNVTFIANNRTIFRPARSNNSEPLVMLPSFGHVGSTYFDGWYTDEACTKLLKDFEISSDTTLYAKWTESTKTATITFDTRGGTPVKAVTTGFGTVLALPDTTKKDGCTFLMWEDNSERIVPTEQFEVPPSESIELYAVWACTHIATAEDMITLAKVVNNGYSFENSKVYLDADIDFTNAFHRFEPIGRYSNTKFTGTFDGQGHTISNLNVRSVKHPFLGLFGTSLSGLTVENVVLDASCSFEDAHTGFSGMVAGIVAMCKSNDNSCKTRNCVNMANITFSGSTLSYSPILAIGGITAMGASGLDVSIENCVNYGAITFSGESAIAYVGGITAYYMSGNEAGSLCTIESCANYGTVTYNGVASLEFAVGGILGHGNDNALIVNSMSVGAIMYNDKKRENVNNKNISVGVIIGSIDDGGNVTHCLWTDTVGDYEICGSGSSHLTIESSEKVKMGTEALESLNKYAEAKNLETWTMLHLNGGKLGSSESDTVLVTGKDFPVPASSNGIHVFSYWSATANCRERYDKKKNVSELYAAWDMHIVSFNYENGTRTEWGFKDGETIEYPPTPSKPGQKFAGWCTKDGKTCMPRTMHIEDIDLYPTWDSSKMSKGTIIAISVGGFLGIVIIIVIIIVVVMFIKKRSEKNTGATRPLIYNNDA